MTITSKFALRRVAAGASAAALAVTFGTALATGASAAEGTDSGAGDHISWSRTVSDTNPHVGDKITVTNTLSGTGEAYTLTEENVKSVLPGILKSQAGKVLGLLQDAGLAEVSGSVPKYITAMESGLDGCFAYKDGTAAVTRDGSDLTGWSADTNGAISDTDNNLQVSNFDGATPLTWTADYKVNCAPGTYEPSVSGTVDYAIEVPIGFDNPLYKCRNIPLVGETCGPGQEHYDYTFSTTITDTAFTTASGPAITVRGAVATTLGVDPAPQAGEDSALTATVTNADEGDTVTFTNNGTEIGTATLGSDGTASITWTPDADTAGEDYSLVAAVDGVDSDAVTGTIAAAEDTGGTDPDDGSGNNGDGSGDTGGDDNDDAAGLLQSLQSLQSLGALFG